MSDILKHTALRSLPHGPGFRFLDCVLELVPGVSGSGEYKVRGSEPFLADHFPGHPLFPGVLLLESGAQLAGVVAQSDPSVGAIPGLKLTAMRSVKIYGTAVPGDTLYIQAAILGRMSLLIQAEVQVRVASRLLLKGEITLSGEPGSTS